MLEAFGISALVVAIGEIGDKTQLLALLLATRYPKQAVAILAGILVATLANHGLAGVLGAWLREAVDPQGLRWIVGASFLAIAAWALVPDTLDDDAAPSSRGRGSVFLLTTIAFFVAEIGDKTQLATVTLAARFDALPAVIAGTTAGMLIADAPAVLLADALSRRLSFRRMRQLAAALFAALGIATLAGVGGWG